MTTIKESAFEETDITTIEIPNTVTTIEEDAFYEAEHLTAVTIPGSVNSLGYDAFHDCTAMTRFVFEPSPTNTPLTIYRGYDAPFYFSPLEYIHVNRQIVEKETDGDDMTDTQDRMGVLSVFKTLPQQEIIIGEQLENLTYKMFGVSYCTTITIPTTVQSVGTGAFFSNSRLNTVVVEESSEPITFKGTDSGPNAFYSAPLTSITLNREVTCLDEDGEPYTAADTDEGVFSTNKAFIGGYDDLECTVNIGANVKNILPYMFSQVQVKTVNIPDGVETIGTGAFYECGKLTAISIPGTVNSIGNDAFYDCESLSSVTFLPSNNHTKLTMGCHIGTDDVGPFYYSPLAYINIDREIELTAEYKEQLDDWDMGIFSNDYYNEDDLTTQVIIGSNVKTIYDWMFSCVRMRSVEIPASVTSIGKEAFSYCYILDEVKLHQTTPPTLGEYAFYDCGKDTENDKLDAIKVPSGSVEAFKNATNWKSYDDIITGW